MTRTLAHISDLHLGRDAATNAAVARIAAVLEGAGIDEVLVTGDVTHRGRREELALFERTFVAIRDRLVVVPGNHDRLGDDVARLLMPVRRVDVEVRPGVYVVRMDSTAPHNARLVNSHGVLDANDLADAETAIGAAPNHVLVVVMLHHHVLPLPEDHLVERVASWLGLPHAAELATGRDLLGRVRGRADLVLHGHRHGEAEIRIGTSRERKLRVVNAGCTPDSGRIRVLRHERGVILDEQVLDARPPASMASAAA